MGGFAGNLLSIYLALWVLSLIWLGRALRRTKRFSGPLGALGALLGAGAGALSARWYTPPGDSTSAIVGFFLYLVIACAIGTALMGLLGALVGRALTRPASRR